MKGIELSKKFYEQFGKPMLINDFQDILPYIAVGFTGSGSEKYGFDDEISKDHDYDVGFTIFLPDECKVDSRREFALERAYYKLPKEFEGITRQAMSPVGGNRNGPVRYSDYFLSKIGERDGVLSVKEWLTVPDYAFFEATNGEIFYDGLGEVTKIREYLKNIPEDIRKKRIAGNLLVMAQSGQYNFNRCAKRNEKEAVSFCTHEFVSSAIKVLFLLKGKFAPYYKWSFRALREIEDEKLIKKLSFILTESNLSDEILQEKYFAIEEVASMVIDRLNMQNLTKATCGDLEKHAYSVNDGIADGDIRNLDILVSIN